MKNKLMTIFLGTLLLTSCKKDRECECTTVYYDAEGIYVGSQSDIKYIVKNKQECDAYNKSTTTEVTNCHYDD